MQQKVAGAPTNGKHLHEARPCFKGRRETGFARPQVPPPPKPKAPEEGARAQRGRGGYKFSRNR